eukprot:8381188-Alexandrium_andersonii.AAC.1
MTLSAIGSSREVRRVATAGSRFLVKDLQLRAYAKVNLGKSFVVASNRWTARHIVRRVGSLA